VRPPFFRDNRPPRSRGPIRRAIGSAACASATVDLVTAKARDLLKREFGKRFDLVIAVTVLRTRAHRPYCRCCACLPISANHPPLLY
jgi:hypothetical protein